MLGIRTEEEFERRFAGTPLTRPGRAGLLRNCCVAAGNLGLRRAVPALDPVPARGRIAAGARSRGVGAGGDRGRGGGARGGRAGGVGSRPASKR